MKNCVRVRLKTWPQAAFFPQREATSLLDQGLLQQIHNLMSFCRITLALEQTKIPFDIEANDHEIFHDEAPFFFELPVTSATLLRWALISLLSSGALSLRTRLAALGIQLNCRRYGGIP